MLLCFCAFTWSPFSWLESSYLSLKTQLRCSLSESFPSLSGRVSYHDQVPALLICSWSELPKERERESRLHLCLSAQLRVWHRPSKDHSPVLEFCSISHLLFFSTLEEKDSTACENKAVSSVREAEELVESGVGLSQGRTDPLVCCFQNAL